MLYAMYKTIIYYLIKNEIKTIIHLVRVFSHVKCWWDNMIPLGFIESWNQSKNEWKRKLTDAHYHFTIDMLKSIM